MASAWTGNGPITLPPKALAITVAGALVVLAFVGVGMGMRAAWRDNGAPDLGGVETTGTDTAGTVTATPIVELPAVAAPAASNTVAADASADNSADQIDQKTAEAQQVQSTAARSGGDIDKILASPTEKPPAPSKSTAVEAPPPPGPPVKSDVPF
ncbi:MAG TPA: hypothetical protein VIC25_10065 [Caulobacteraceae bacterium]|jgi:hypothetical protein